MKNKELNTQISLKQLAKELYFLDVKVQEWRDNFLSKLNEKEVIDKRGEKYYCHHCGKFSEKMAFQQKNKIVFPKHLDEIWIVNTHYDGCGGWD